MGCRENGFHTISSDRVPRHPARHAAPPRWRRLAAAAARRATAWLRPAAAVCRAARP
jgi:hypothetical protein